MIYTHTTRLAVLLAAFLAATPGVHLAMAQAPATITIDDFQSDAPDTIPQKMRGLSGRDLVRLTPEMREEGERYSVQRSGSNHYLAIRVDDESVRLVYPNDDGMNWDFSTHRYLSWRWRPHALPQGGREDSKRDDDVVGAVYVTFKGVRTAFGIGPKVPRSIKYTYSSTLPIGTSFKQGELCVIVVGSGAGSLSQWQSVRRDVYADYERAFGEAPPERPLSLAIWSDSDSIGGTSAIDFDDLQLHSRAQ